MTTEKPKPYDQAFKSLSDRSPRELLDVFGVLPLEAEAEVESLPRDIAMRPLAIDTAFLIRRRRRKPYIAVFEAATSWEQDMAQRLACYGALIAIKYRIPVQMYVLPLAQHACPKHPPARGTAIWGGVRVDMKLNWIKPWEIDGRVILARGWPELDPWAVLFQLSPEQRDDVMERLNQDGRGQDASLFRLLGGMRYRKSKQEWIALLERMKQMIRPGMFLESLAVEDWREEGRQEGRLIEARHALTAFLHARFPKLDVAAAIQSSNDFKALRALIPKVAVARDEDAVKRAMKTLLKPVA